MIFSAHEAYISLTEELKKTYAFYSAILPIELSPPQRNTLTMTFGFKVATVAGAAILRVGQVFVTTKKSKSSVSLPEELA